MLPLASAVDGFWGPVTSTVDWCERNYVFSRFIAEFFNTTSSLAMVTAGLLGWFLHRGHEPRVRLTFFSITVIGLGSIAFHGTLKESTQALDELPMMWSGFVILFVLLEHEPRRRFGTWMPVLLALLAAAVTVAYAVLEGPARFWTFIFFFGGAELTCLAIGYRLYRRYATREVRWCFRAGLTLHLVAFGLWLVDTHGCDVVSALPYGIPNPQLHAWWHTLVSMGIYLLYLVIAHFRATILGREPEFAFALGAIPYVRATRPPRPDAGAAPAALGAG